MDPRVDLGPIPERARKLTQASSVANAIAFSVETCYRDMLRVKCKTLTHQESKSNACFARIVLLRVFLKLKRNVISRLQLATWVANYYMSEGL